jgi:PPM family protein phosphatase
MSLKGKIQTCGMTHEGRVRDHNEDAIGTEDEAGLLVLADGMGGYAAGEVASAIAIETVTKRVLEGLETIKRGEVEDEATGLTTDSALLGKAVEEANRAINGAAASQPQCEGMGTTIVACLFYDNRICIAHVGDSRLYRIRNDEFQQITLDHSLLQELISRGFYTPAEARKSLNKNLVTRALGVDPTVDVEVQEDVVLVGDTFLLCSDGLSDMVEDDDIHLTISTFSANLQMAAEQLVQLANENGGRDNISVILSRVEKSFEAKKGFFSRFTEWFG